MGGRPNPQDQACQGGRDRPLCPQFTLRETATDALLLPIVCGRTGLHPQVSGRFNLQLILRKYHAVTVLSLCRFHSSSLPMQPTDNAVPQWDSFCSLPLLWPARGPGPRFRTWTGQDLGGGAQASAYVPVRDAVRQ